MGWQLRFSSDAVLQVSKAVAFGVLKRWLNSRVSGTTAFEVLMQWKPGKTAFEDLVQCLNCCNSVADAFDLSMHWLNCGEVTMGSGPGAAVDDSAAGYNSDVMDDGGLVQAATHCPDSASGYYLEVAARIA